MSTLPPYSTEGRVRELEAELAQLKSTRESELALLRQERDAARLLLMRIHRLATTGAGVRGRIGNAKIYLREIVAVSELDAELVSPAPVRYVCRRCGCDLAGELRATWAGRRCSSCGGIFNTVDDIKPAPQ